MFTLVPLAEIAPDFHHPIFKKNGDLKKHCFLIGEYNNYNSKIELFINDKEKEKEKSISVFNINGSFSLYKKNKKTLIYCSSDVTLKNNVFGEYILKKNKIYSFNLETVGRDPILKRNNHFIAKRRISQLLNSGKLPFPEKYIKEIVEKI